MKNTDAPARPRLAVIGKPIAHSLSPIIHQHWLDDAHKIMRYEKLEVPKENLMDFLADLRRNNFLGLNITLPHKQQVYAYARAQGWELDASAAACGSVNHLSLRGGGVIKAASTDGEGFLRALGQVPNGGAPAMIIGAGGAAFAIAFALKRAGVKKLYLVNRTKMKAEVLAEKLAMEVEILSFENYASALSEVALLVQASSLGMKSFPPLVFDLRTLPSTALVMDIVYQPLRTELLCAAEARGNKTLDGLTMLFHQAALSFQDWFGMEVEITENLRKGVERFL